MAVTYFQEGLHMGWTMTLGLDADSLRTIKTPLMLVNMIDDDERLHAHKHNLDLILSELLSNALEWGILRLNGSIKKDAEAFEHYFSLRQKALNSLVEGWIKISLEYTLSIHGGKFVIRVEDSGPGFDYQNLDAFYDNAVFGGRGIYHVRALCEEFAYYGNGNRVKAVYGWGTDA
jgi:two-component system, HptB-dependent secretion and biofilm response regulator